MSGVEGDENWRRESLRMWEFVLGIEGFGVCRAADCLSKLLHAHYDTMSVLKLVTKRDLIEDAGLKPGDALRIVAAAKEFKPLADKPKRPQRRAVLESTSLTEIPEPAKKVNF